MLSKLQKVITRLTLSQRSGGSAPDSNDSAPNTPRPDLPATDLGSPFVPEPSGHLRVVIHTDTYDETLTYLRDVLGLTTVMHHELPDDDRVTILDAGRATLEIATTAHAKVIDGIERSREPAPQFRLAIEAVDSAATAHRLVAAGATPLAPATRTPWRSVNARVALADGVHLTVFQQLDPGPETGPRPDQGDPHD